MTSILGDSTFFALLQWSYLLGANVALGLYITLTVRGLIEKQVSQ